LLVDSIWIPNAGRVLEHHPEAFDLADKANKLAVSFRPVSLPSCK